MMKRISAAALDKLLKALNDYAALYLPSEQNGTDKRAKYTRYTDGVKYSPALNTVRSPKDFFFPQTENLVNFKIDGKKIEIIDPRKEHEDFIIFGVRACDAKAFEVLDKVFLSDPVDSYYASLRDHGIIMTMSCSRPAETCFCTTFGIDPSEPGGDIACVADNEWLYLDAKTEKGEKLLSALADILCDCEDNAADEQKKVIKERMARLPLSELSAEKFGKDKTEEFFEDPAWAELSEACIACGTCTYVCPTCQCYDIKDFDTGHGIERFRCWDSCMYSEFTKMSAGQPRQTHLQRFRQRFMHKLVYIPTNNDGLFGCVGCGRCLMSCPISMNIVKVMKKLAENK